MLYGSVIWDFDGTLADTLATLLQLYNDFAARRSLRPITDVEAARNLTPLAFLKEYGIPLRTVPALVRATRAAHRERMADTRLFPGVRPALEAFRRAGCRMGILSSNSAANIRLCLQANGVEPLFESVVGYLRLLGKGRTLRGMLRSGGHDPRRTVYVGDEVRDIEAARQAGIASAAVSWGLNSRALLAAHAPDYLLDRPEELLKLMD